MKKLSLGLSLALILGGVSAVEARESVVLRDGWKFSRDEHPGMQRYFAFDKVEGYLDRPETIAFKPYQRFEQPTFDDSKWQDVRVPHDWGVEHAFLCDMPHLDGYLDVTGPGWYRMKFQVEGGRLKVGGKSCAMPSDGRVFFETDGAMSFAMVWINGHFVGGWPYGYTPWRVELTPWVKPDGDNVLAIRCHVWKDASRWYTGGGLYRECRLVCEKADHVVPGSVRITTPSVTTAEATVKVAWEMTQGGKKTKTFTVENPRLWDVDDPYLYETEVEGQKFRYGIRTISFHADGRGFQLNGRRVHLRGMCLHHDLGAIGTAFNVSAARRRLEKLREAGCNAIRSAHNQPDPRLLELCDEMGFLVMDEVFDQWSICKSGNDYGRLYRRWWERDLRTWIRTDRNHPSVIIWGFGNEIMESRMTDLERERFKELAKEMVRVCHEEDSTRPATTACDEPKNGFNGYAEIPDIYGFNYRPNRYAEFHAKYPDKPFFGSETCCALMTRGEFFFPVNFGKRRTTYGFPYWDYHASGYGWDGDYSPDYEWDLQEKTPSVMGDFTWTGFDYLAGTFSTPMLRRHPQFTDPERQKAAEAEVRKYGTARSGMHTCPTGIFDLAGFAKDQFYLYQSKWRPDLKMCHLLPHWNWPERVGKNVPVYAYSTGDEVELFVNGVSQGRRRREPGFWRFAWNDVTYAPGAIRAVAYRDGKPWAEETVETAGAAVALEVMPEKASIAADGEELGYVTVRVVDARGRLVPRACPRIRIAVEGAGEFVAADNGDESDFDGFKETERKAFNGLLSVLVRAKPGAKGEIRVSALADGLSPASAALGAGTVPTPAKAAADAPKGFVLDDAIDIDSGRQLFVDDFIIAATNGVVRHWNDPVKAPSPVLRPTSEKDGRLAGCTVATDGGLWWDPTIGKYRLWYESDWAGNLRYAESRDGLAWEFPDLGKVKGTNRVFGDDEERVGKSLDSWSVWPDYRAANPYGAWNMLISAPGGLTTDTMFTSADGRRFECLGVAGYSGDRTTMHFDAILDRWVFSLRDSHKPLGRARRFHAQDEFRPAKVPYSKRPQTEGSAVPAIWGELDVLDYGPRGSLYNFDAVPYESLMLGVMEVLHNTPRDNFDSECAGLPKQTSLRFAFSRDGRRYVPAPASALKPSGWGSGKWDTGYLSAVGGICTVGENELRFYYSALRGDAERRRDVVGKQPMHRQGMYYNGSIGYATMRRDGFAGLVADGDGTVTTKPVLFSGGHLFVNAECLFGEVAAEILDEKGVPIAGYAAADCRQMKFADSTKRELVFAGGDLSAFRGRTVGIRFRLHCATLYSFWVSPSSRGESRGYVAAGGPAYSGLRDL